MNGDCVIKGDTKEFKNCLVCVAGKTYEDAEGVLKRMLNNPTENDKRLMTGHTNFRIKFVEEKDYWWNGNCD